MTAEGVCTNAKCARAAHGDLMELYPGPGQYCPECGELLTSKTTAPAESPVAPAPPVAPVYVVPKSHAAPESPVVTEPRVAAKSAVATELHAAPQPQVSPEPHVAPEPRAAPEPQAAPEPRAAPEPHVAPEPRAAPEPQAAPEPHAAPVPDEWPEPYEDPYSDEASRRRGPKIGRGPLIGAAAAVVALIVALLVFAAPSLPVFAVRVCTSSMTDRVANEMVRTFSANHSAWPYHYLVTPAGDQACDVRFFADPSGSPDAIFAHDGVVAIVNPQNPLARLEVAQLRDILSGRIIDWSQLGGRRAPVAVAAPDYYSDEAHETAARVMGNQPVGSGVNRAMTATQIVRWVSSPSGAHAIGIVPFSVALPAKVLALGHAAAPSTLSIADGRYPLSVGIMVGSDFRNPSGPADALLTFAHSSGADGVIIRTALITKNGL